MNSRSNSIFVSAIPVTENVWSKECGGLLSLCGLRGPGEEIIEHF